MLIRDALPGELPAIGDLRVTAYQADGFGNGSYAGELRRLGTDGSGEVLAAMDGETLVGTVMLWPWPSADEIARGPGEAEIRALAVAPQARGRGIGRELVSAVVGRAASRGVRHLLLLTRPEMHAAQHLYTGAGFRRLPERDISPGVDLIAYGLEL
ncbi:MAG: GNAT family N-acetyltransferase [Actinobacteria bacterium]|nr:GNAT family N-acetyltransferase [Actinomycetota bacterium]MBO0818703.1 GNAT family N-acetyltransferase [Actinomycetota bacterium]